MLPLSTLNSVKERGSNGALRSYLFAKGRTRRGGSRLRLDAENRFQGKVWIKMIGTQPVAIEER